MVGDLTDLNTEIATDTVMLVKMDTAESIAMAVDEKWYKETVLDQGMSLFSLELTFDHEEGKVGYVRVVFDGKVQLAYITIHADINAPPTSE